MRIPGGKKGWGALLVGPRQLSVGRTRGQQCWEEQLSNAEATALLLIPVHLQGEEGPWPRWGLKQAAVLCVPSWGARPGAACHGNGPSASEEEWTWPQRPCPAPLFFADRRKATSLEPLPAFFVIFPRREQSLESELTVREDWQGGQIWVLAKR